MGLAGNIGDSFAKQILEKDFKNYVLEISSFQLDDIVDFKPHIAVITNITPDRITSYNVCYTKLLRVIIFISSLAIVMIASSHSADKKVYEIARLKNEA